MPGGPEGVSPPAFGTRRRALRAVRCRVLPPPLPPLWPLWPMTTPTTASRPTAPHGHPKRSGTWHRWAHATVYETVARLADLAGLADERTPIHHADADDLGDHATPPPRAGP